jgi:hypothetical protein
MTRSNRIATAAALALALAGCAAHAPQYGEVVTMTVSEAALASDVPPPGTVWRLDERDLKRLSPAPAVEPPPAPALPPPPRPNDPPPSFYFYPLPYFYGPHLYWWGPSLHFWRRR